MGTAYDAYKTDVPLRFRGRGLRKKKRGISAEQLPVRVPSNQGLAGKLYPVDPKKRQRRMMFKEVRGK
jgi:hypothetical protein